jgi:hypothetical protein
MYFVFIKYVLLGIENNEKQVIMKTVKKQTRFMNGNIDVEGFVFDLLVNEYGLKAVLESNFDTDNAIYSNGFVLAIMSDKVPTLELQSTTSHRYSNELEEYHHVIINDECYNVYFK